MQSAYRDQGTGSLSQKTAAKASYQRLHISTSKGHEMAAVSNETLKQLVMIPQEFRKISFWKFLGGE